MENKTKFARFIDNLVLTFIVTLLAFLFLNRYFKNIYLSLIISLIFGFIFIKISSGLQYKKYRKIGLKKEELKNIENTNIYLRKLTFNQQMIYFKKLFSELSPKISNKFLILSNKIVIFNNLNQSELSIDTLFDIYSRVKKLSISPHEIAIICNSISPRLHESKKQFNDVNFSFITPEYLYALTKKFNQKIEFGTDLVKKHNLKSIISKISVKKQSKYFIRCGLLLYITSFMVPFARYYIISASICLIIGALCLIFGSKEIKTPESKLL